MGLGSGHWILSWLGGSWFDVTPDNKPAKQSANIDWQGKYLEAKKQADKYKEHADHFRGSLSRADEEFYKRTKQLSDCELQLNELRKFNESLQSEKQTLLTTIDNIRSLVYKTPEHLS
jgi:predicted KAP-like P-loop ATPase